MTLPAAPGDHRPCVSTAVSSALTTLSTSREIVQYSSFHDHLSSFSVTWTFGWLLPLALVNNVAVSFDVKSLLSLFSVLLSIFL